MEKTMHNRFFCFAGREIT